ncbi:MAG: hypothetical protein ABI906_11955 [Pseudomonadota bacterium]
MIAPAQAKQTAEAGQAQQAPREVIVVAGVDWRRDRNVTGIRRDAGRRGVSRWRRRGGVRGSGGLRDRRAGSEQKAGERRRAKVSKYHVKPSS